MTEEQLKQAIHFRTIDAPCCGNCKWFRREFEDTKCKHPQNIWNYPEPENDVWDNKLDFNKEHDVCDRFERKQGRSAFA